MQIDTFTVREPADQRTTPPHVLPIYATSSFSFEDIEQGIGIFKDIESGHAYSRYANPTVDTVAQKIADLETYGLGLEATAVMTSSGMAAIATLLLGTLKAGDKVLSQGNLYGGTTELLTTTFAQFGVETILTDLKDLNRVAEILRQEPGIKMLY